MGTFQHLFLPPTLISSNSSNSFIFVDVKALLLYLFCFLLLSLPTRSLANDSLVMQQLVKKIYRHQVQNDTYFPDGLFPSFREYYFNRGTLKKDDNSFFTGLIVFTLRKLQPFLDTSSRRLCDSIIEKSLPTFQMFRNRKGKNVYSFWPTRPLKYFPNSGLLSLFKMNALPDDADCSVIVLMAMNASSTSAEEVHLYMQDYTNNKKNKVHSTFTDYKELPAYSTWLGHNVPIDFDVCVFSNILYFVHAYNLPYTKADSASLHLICQSILKRQYQTDAVFLSPYYNKTSIILYHLSRLMSVRRIPELEQYRNQLIDDARACYAKADNPLERIILSTSLMRWGVVLPEFDNDHLLVSSFPSSQDLVFFVANMASMLPNPVNRSMTKTNLGRFDYYCPAYNDVLLLENLVLRELASKKIPHQECTSIP